MKTLKVKFTKSKGTTYMQVVEQSHRLRDFGNEMGGQEFTAKNGQKLGSYYYPEDDNIVYVRGSERGDDSKKVELNSHTQLKIEQAVKEYNEYFSRTPDSIPTKVSAFKPKIPVCVEVDTNTSYHFQYPGYSVFVGPDGITTVKN